MSISKSLYEFASKIFPGGVNSPARALKPYPIYVKRAEGSKLYTVDGEIYIDYSLGFGPMILGHRDPDVLDEVRRQLEKGWLYGACSELEIKLAKKIQKYFPSMEMMRFVNSGTEATMNVIRVARGYTGRKKIIMFEGGYHGSYDSVLVKAGSSALTYSVPMSKGILGEVINHTIVLPYNDLKSVENILSKYSNEVAGIIVEPVAVNMGLVPPRNGFIEGLRELADKYNVLLIIDEVVTGFRIAMGGAQEYFNLKADLMTLGKIIGGGFPIGVFGGKKEYMENVTPLGKVHNAGTFNAHPVSVAAGLATIKKIERTNAIEKSSNYAYKLTTIIRDLIERYDLNVTLNRFESMFQLFFTNNKIINYDDVKTSNKELYLKFHRLLMKNGVYFAPSQYETCFTSSSHTDEDLDKTVSALEIAFKEVRNEA